MTIGSTLGCEVEADNTGGATFPSSFSAAWKTVIDAGGLATADNSGTVTNPTVHCTTSTTHIFQKPKRGGTLITARVGYDPTLAITVSPVLVLFGRTRIGDGDTATYTAWERLYNKATLPTTSVTFTAVNTTDVQVAAGFEGTSAPALAYTEVDPQVHVWDCKSCNEFVFGKLAAIAGATGVTTTSILQVKWL